MLLQDDADPPYTLDPFSLLVKSAKTPRKRVLLSNFPGKLVPLLIARYMFCYVKAHIICPMFDKSGLRLKLTVGNFVKKSYLVNEEGNGVHIIVEDSVDIAVAAQSIFSKIWTCGAQVRNSDIS